MPRLNQPHGRHAIIDDRRSGERSSFRGCPRRQIGGGAALTLGSEPACGAVFNGSLLPAIRGAAPEPLTFPVLDVANRLTTGGAAIARRVAGRGHGGFVAAWPIAEGGEKKIFCCVTTRGRNFGVINGLGRDFGSLPALLLGLGMPHFDARVLATFSLAASRLPAADLPQAFRVLAVALVPAPRLVLASASFAQADPRARSPRSRQTAVALGTVKGAHGSGNSQGKSSGRMLVAFSSGVIKTRTRRLLASLSSSREQDREINGLIDGLGTRTPSAARQTIVFSRTRQRNKRSHSTCWEQEP